MVSQEHRALGMPFGGVEQRAESLAGIAAALGEPLGDEARQIVRAQRTEVDRTGLREERVAAIAEEIAHEARMGAGEDVAGGLPVALELGAKDTGQRRVDANDLLELVERDHA